MILLSLEKNESASKIIRPTQSSSIVIFKHVEKVESKKSSLCSVESSGFVI